MFTTEIRLNGTLFAHVYGRNICTCISGYPSHECAYTYEYYEIETRKVRKGEVSHNKHDSIRKLISKILDSVEKEENDEKGSGGSGASSGGGRRLRDVHHVAEHANELIPPLPPAPRPIVMIKEGQSPKARRKGDR
jgi:hypothetical protein